MIEITKKDELERKKDLKIANDSLEALKAIQKNFEERGAGYEEYVKTIQVHFEEFSNQLNDLLARPLEVDGDKISQVIYSGYSRLIESFNGTLTKTLSHVRELQAVDPNVIVDLTGLEVLLRETLPQMTAELIKAIPKVDPKPFEDKLKEIIELLKKIENKPIVTGGPMGGGGGGGISSNRLFGFLAGTGAPVKLAAIESVDHPGVYGLLVLNPDGTAIGTGGGSVTPSSVYGSGTYGSAAYA